MYKRQVAEEEEEEVISRLLVGLAESDTAPAHIAVDICMENVLKTERRIKTFERMIRHFYSDIDRCK